MQLTVGQENDPPSQITNSEPAGGTEHAYGRCFDFTDGEWNDVGGILKYEFRPLY